MILFCFVAEAQELPVIKNHLAFSYDDIELPQKESMGLIGGKYLIAFTRHIYSGLGVYGAVKGRRGGFFTGGLELGWRQSIFSNLFVDINGFVGGGGGGSAPQGGGLMLRSSFDVGVNFKHSSVGLGYSYVEFPNGNISSHQLSINTRYTFNSFHFSGWSREAGNLIFLDKLRDFSQARSSQFSLQLTRYFPHDSVGVNGEEFDKHLDILGIRWRNSLGNKFWLEFETGGAMLGNIDGFAQVFSGLSYESYLNKNIYGNLGVLIGAAGGGNVNTGGGLVYRSFAGLGYHISPQWSIASQIAWTAAFEGEFKAKTATLNLTYHYKSLIPVSDRSSNVKLVESKRNVNWRYLRIRPGIQRYSHYDGSGRKNSSMKNIDVNLVSLKLDSFINSHFYLTGQALGAFSGEAGGYAVGLVGPGFTLGRYVSAELLGGVAGGGGIAVGSGQVVQPMLNIAYPLDDRWEVEGSLGYILAVNDRLSAVVTNLGIIYRFRSPYI